MTDRQTILVASVIRRTFKELGLEAPRLRVLVEVNGDPVTPTICIDDASRTLPAAEAIERICAGLNVPAVKGLYSGFTN